MLIGLASKSAILIVEFAKVRCDAGVPAAEAAVSAARLRFRAVMMTALSFILGVLPLVAAGVRERCGSGEPDRDRVRGAERDGDGDGGGSGVRAGAVLGGGAGGRGAAGEVQQAAGADPA